MIGLERTELSEDATEATWTPHQGSTRTATTAMASLRLTFISSSGDKLSARNSLGSEITSVPEWVTKHVQVSAWTGQSLPLEDMCRAADELHGALLTNALHDARDNAIEWSWEDTTSTVDLALPLLLLARDLRALGRKGVLILEGA